MTGLPIVSSASIPADVRRGGRTAEQTYEGALALERVFLEQLASGMQSSVEAVGDDAGSGDDSSAGQLGGAYASLLPGALADAVSQDGGLGLADTLYQALQAQQGVAAGTAGSPSSSSPPAGTGSAAPGQVGGAAPAGVTS